MNIKYTKENLEPVVLDSISYADCLKKLGLVVAGGNYSLLHRNIIKFGIDTSHMLHQAHNRGKELKPFDGLTRNKSIKTRLIKEFGHACTKCKLADWLGQPITLELEHIDGDNMNNEKSNLTLLCPNCHSQTPTWRNRKRN